MVPTVPPLYWIWVLPASSPSADLKTMVIFGPSARIRVTATQAPAIAATMGTIQTRESRVCFLPTALESGMFGGDPSPSAMADLSRALRLPDQTPVNGP